jgi:hypothetical protein
VLVCRSRVFHPKMPRELLADYPISAARYDEMLEAPLTPRR